MKRRQMSVLLTQLSVGAWLGSLSVGSYCEQCQSFYLLNHHLNGRNDEKSAN